MQPPNTVTMQDLHDAFNIPEDGEGQRVRDMGHNGLIPEFYQPEGRGTRCYFGASGVLTVYQLVKNGRIRGNV